MYLKLVTVLLMLGLTMLVHAQSENEWVNRYEDTWSIRAYGIVKAQGLQLSNKDGERLSYLPDNIFGIGLGLSYDFINIDLGLTIGGPETITNRFDFQGNVFIGRSTFDLYLQAYKGFRVSHPDQISPPEQATREDIRTVATGINYLFAFNGDKLSARSIFTGDHRQQKSVGSWMVGGFTSFFLMQADSSIVPVNDDRFAGDAQLKNITLNSTGVTGGYGYNHVFPSKFNIFVSVLPGIGLNGGNITAMEVFSPQFSEVYRLQATLALGYGNEKIYTMLSSSTDYYWVNLGETRFIYSLIKVKASVGLRFSR